MSGISKTFALRKLICFLGLVLVWASLALFAQGKAGAFVPADGLEDWKQSIDLSTYPSGEYNLVVEGKDKAGNVTRTAPINVFVDPKAGLPTVAIINPTQGMRVGGDLNIVGTCACSRKLQMVEVRLDGGDWIKAEGTDFWSIYMKTLSMSEGRRTLEVRGTDVDQRVGPTARIQFDLDKSAPSASVQSPPMGSLVAGQITIRGSVYDGNGIRSFDISQDGKTWTSVALDRGKDALRPGFSFSVDTKKYSDGPKIFHLRSVDGVGSTSNAVYIVFVENSQPVIDLVRPIKDKAVFGHFAIAGSVHDAVGLKKLSYEFGPDDKGEIPLTAGDPFFAKEFDAGKIKGDSVQITLIAENKIGTVTRLTRQCKIDREAELPVLKVLGPLPKAPSSDVKGGSKSPPSPALLRPGEYVWGSIRDIDAVSSFRWSLDGGALTEVPCSEVFSLSLPDAPSGLHTLSLTPVDVAGRSGHPVLLPLFIDKGPGRISFDRLALASGASAKSATPAGRDFVQGIETSVDAGEQLELTVDSPNALVSADYAVSGAGRHPLPSLETKGKVARRFFVPLDHSLPYGFASIEVFAKDAAGNEFSAKALLYVTNYSIAREEPGFRFSDSRVQSDGSMLFGLDSSGAPRPISGAFYGGELASIRFDPPTDSVAASFSGRSVTLTPKKGGRSAPTRIFGKTASGREFGSGPFVFVAAAPGPEIDINSPSEGTWFNKAISVTGKTTSPLSAVDLTWRLLPDGTSQKAGLKKDGSFSINLSAADLPQGPCSIEFEAKDGLGTTSHAYLGLGVDSAGPKLSFLSPEKDAAVWGPEDVAAMMSSVSGIVSVEYAADGSTFSAIDRNGMYFVHRADLAANPKALYRVKDAAGNVTLARPVVSIASAPPSSPSLNAAAEKKAGASPVLTLVYPDVATKSLSGPVSLIVKVEGDSPLASLVIANGSGKPFAADRASEGGRYFAVPLDPASKGSSLSLAITAKDQAGKVSKLALSYGYDKAGADPKIMVDALVPAAGGLVLGSVSGLAGPVPASVAIDGSNERSFPAGSFAFALPALAAGKHVLSVKAGETIAKRDFTVKADAPALGDFRIVDGKSSSSWSPGADYSLGPASMLVGSVSGGNGQATVTATFNGGAPLPANLSKTNGGGYTFSVPIPPSLAYALVSVELRAKDAAGSEAVERLELHKILSPSQGIDDNEAIRFADERIAAADGKDSLLLSQGGILRGRFNGRPIKSVSIVPPTPCLAASFDGPAVMIEAKDSGKVSSAVFTLTTVDGDSFSWGPFSATIASEGPTMEVSAPTEGDWNSASVRVAGKASDPQGIVSLSLAINGGEAASLLDAASSAKAKSDISFDKTWPLEALDDGPVRLDFVARNGTGRESRLTRFIYRQSAAPLLAQVLPLPEESVDGLTSFIAETSEASLASISFQPSKDAEPEILWDARAPHAGLIRRDLDLARIAMPLAQGCGFIATDKAGNSSVLSPNLTVDAEKGKPVAEIDTPSDMEVIRGDFIISGVAYTTKGLAAIYYRIDNAAWTKLPMDGSGFSIPIALKDTTDNEHLVEVKAEDIYGVQGNVVSRKYRISKEEPKATMTAPSITKPVRGVIRIEGTASDANGIKEVRVSIDGRATFDAPVGTNSWSIGLDTTTLSDGIHAVAVKPVDGYDTEGFYASMLTVDNTPPKAQLDLPSDGEDVGSTILVSGRVSDNLGIAKSRIEVSPVGSGKPATLSVDLGQETIVRRTVDISSLKPGDYTVRLIVDDRADNESMASRIVRVTGALPLDSLSLLFPQDGESYSTRLRVQGRAKLASGAPTVTILADGASIGSADTDALGWFSFDLPRGALADGEHRLKARAVSKEGRSIDSDEHRVEWKNLGPWVTIDSLPSGKYIGYRPFLSGSAGWFAGDPPKDKEGLAAFKKDEESHRISRVDLSLDDGASYAEAHGGENWNFRLETQDFKEGALHVIVRAKYADGSSACAKAVYFLDKTPPQVEVLSPSEGGSYNGNLVVSGRAFDDNGLQDVQVALRKGDKSGYEVPSFIQGLFLDGQVLGATDWEAGAGLTFFNDNVKLEALYGNAPLYDSNGESESFYGPVVGGKLIANVLYLPASSLLGPDWDFLSTSFGLGADFTYFSQTQTGSGLLIGSVFAQLEFPKITFSGMSVFKKISFYTEYQLWVLSSVVAGGFIPKVSFGARVGVF